MRLFFQTDTMAKIETIKASNNIKCFKSSSELNEKTVFNYVFRKNESGRSADERVEVAREIEIKFKVNFFPRKSFSRGF